MSPYLPMSTCIPAYVSLLPMSRYQPLPIPTYLYKSLHTHEPVSVSFSTLIQAAELIQHRGRPRGGKVLGWV